MILLIVWSLLTVSLILSPGYYLFIGRAREPSKNYLVNRILHYLVSYMSTNSHPICTAICRVSAQCTKLNSSLGASVALSLEWSPGHTKSCAGKSCVVARLHGELCIESCFGVSTLVAVQIAVLIGQSKTIDYTSITGTLPHVKDKWVNIAIWPMFVTEYFPFNFGGTGSDFLYKV